MNSKIKILFILLLLLSCSDFEIKSKWRDNIITIDGNKKDWEGSLNYFEDEKIAIGIMNDSENIYLCLTTSDRSKVMKILNNGFTLWFDPQKSEDEIFGIQFPIKKEFNDEMKMIPELNEKKDFDEKNNRVTPNENFPNRMIEKFKSEQNEILILNEDKYPLNVYKLQNDSGLEVFINIEQNQFVYELKIPFAENKLKKVYVDAFPNEEMNLRFETGEIEKPGFNDGSGRNNSKGGMQTPDGSNEGKLGAKGRKGGGMGARKDDRNVSDLMKPIELEITILLASKN